MRVIAPVGGGGGGVWAGGGKEGGTNWWIGWLAQSGRVDKLVGGWVGAWVNWDLLADWLEWTDVPGWVARWVG